MGYASIDNLYANQTILLQPECYALEKLHGSSAHLHYIPAGGDPEPESRGTRLSSGEAILKIFSGEQQANFEALFNKERLLTLFALLSADVRIYGECYGGKVQQNSWRYGKDLKFTAFDVKLNGEWLTIPEAEKLVKFMELEFVHYVRIETKLSLIDAERDATSEQAIRNGVTTRNGEFVRREGVVLRPIEEKPDHRGNRICAKHKRKEERETKTERPVNADKIALSKAARDVAEEWVTANRVGNARSHFSESDWVITNMQNLIRYVLQDVYTEAGTEIEQTPENNREICKRAAQLIKQNFESSLKETTNEA